MQTNLKWVRRPTPPSDWPCLLSTHQYCSEMADHLQTKEWTSELLSSSCLTELRRILYLRQPESSSIFLPRPEARLGRKTINVSWLKNDVYLRSLVRGDKQKYVRAKIKSTGPVKIVLKRSVNQSVENWISLDCWMTKKHRLGLWAELDWKSGLSVTAENSLWNYETIHSLSKYNQLIHLSI